jgi:hypothetical protein
MVMQVPDDIRTELVAFIAAGRDKHPGPRNAGRLRTLHELNAAFSAQAVQPLRDGAAAKLLKAQAPELHARMRAMAPLGHFAKESAA